MQKDPKHDEPTEIQLGPRPAEGDWALRSEQGRTVRRYDTKDDATAGGVLKDALGGTGGSVRIHKEKGLFQEERTFPRRRDPKSSPG